MAQETTQEKLETSSDKAEGKYFDIPVSNLRKKINRRNIFMHLLYNIMFCKKFLKKKEIVLEKKM